MINKWWGYKHVDGSLHTKRWLSHLDIPEAQSSEFVARVTQVFECHTREEAMIIVEERLMED